MRKSGSRPMIGRPIVLNWVDPKASAKSLAQEWCCRLLDQDRPHAEADCVECGSYSSSTGATHKQAPKLTISRGTKKPRVVSFVHEPARAIHLVADAHWIGDIGNVVYIFCDLVGEKELGHPPPLNLVAPVVGAASLNHIVKFL